MSVTHPACAGCPSRIVLAHTPRRTRSRQIYNVRQRMSTPPKARHRPVVEVLATKEGLLVREDYYQHPKGVSNIYLLADDSKIRWEAQLPSADDVFANPIRLEEETFRCSTWQGFSCKISLRTGKIISSEFTK